MAGTSSTSSPADSRKPTAIRLAETQDGSEVRNISSGLKKPLYTSCNDEKHPHPQPPTVRQAGSTATTATAAPPRPRFLTLNSLPRVPSISPIFHQRPEATAMAATSPFLKLPVELRLHIYSLLLLPRQANDLLPSYEKVSSSTQDYYDYSKQRHGTERPSDLSRPVLHLRTVDPVRYPARYPGTPRHARSNYSVRADRFRARCMETTYHCVNNPRIENNMAIMRCNRQIHAEAAELLYSTYTFDFDTHIEAITPFLSDLTPFTRSCIKSVRIVKRALPYLKEFDKCEWHNALRYLTTSNNNINLRRLDLGIVAGRPGDNGWDRVSKYNASDFDALLLHADGMEWMQYLLEINGLQELDVEAVIEHCPPCTSSSAMANYVRFSASVESGFADFLKDQMLTPAVKVC